ncbi:hypothetical protein [uncultured Sphingomonas sp.]
MHSVSYSIGRTIVVLASTLACGSALMFAALGPAGAQAQPIAPVANVAR